jgi:CDP-glucose 4,6-dehydratase
MGFGKGSVEKMVTPQSSFWQGKKVFVTGHTGFKGSWLCLLLKHLGAQVSGYALPADTEPSHFKLLGLEKLMPSTLGDIRDGKKLDEAFQKSQAEILLHLAAQPLVRKSYREPIETFSTNVMGTAQVLESARNLKSLKSIVSVTTDKCYENLERDEPYSEIDILGGHDPYSASKACSEIVTSAWRRSFYENGKKVGIATARAGNVIGGGDWCEDRLFPDMMKAAAKNKVVTIRNPESTRPWQHVLEPLDGYLVLAEKLYSSPEEFSSAWNFGPKTFEKWSVGDIVQRVKKSWDIGVEFSPKQTNAVHEARVLHLDISKTQKKLGWQPRWNIDESVAETVQWYKDFYSKKADVLKITTTQIEKYLNDAK